MLPNGTNTVINSSTGTSTNINNTTTNTNNNDGKAGNYAMFGIFNNNIDSVQNNNNIENNNDNNDVTITSHNLSTVTTDASCGKAFM